MNKIKQYIQKFSFHDMWVKTFSRHFNGIKCLLAKDFVKKDDINELTVDIGKEIFGLMAFLKINAKKFTAFKKTEATDKFMDSLLEAEMTGDTAIIAKVVKKPVAKKVVKVAKNKTVASKKK